MGKEMYVHKIHKLGLTTLFLFPPLIVETFRRPTGHDVLPALEMSSNIALLFIYLINQLIHCV